MSSNLGGGGLNDQNPIGILKLSVRMTALPTVASKLSKFEESKKQRLAVTTIILDLTSIVTPFREENELRKVSLNIFYSTFSVRVNVVSSYLICLSITKTSTFSISILFLLFYYLN